MIGSLYGMWFISHKQDSKMLLVSTPRRKTSLFSQIAPPDENHEKLKICSTAQVRMKLMLDSCLFGHRKLHQVAFQLTTNLGVGGYIYDPNFILRVRLYV